MIKKKFLKTTPLCKVTFTLPKEAIQGAKEIRVLGDFNNWDWEQGIPMKEGGKNFQAEIGLEAGNTYEFRYRSDNYVWENDWQADAYAATPYAGIENSVVNIPPFTIVKETAAPIVAKKTTRKATTKKATAKKTTTRKATTKKAAAKTTTTKATTAKAKKDDLKKIEGIGPKIASLLEAEGITTFAKLGKAPQKTLKKVLADAGNRFKMHDPTTWGKQAKLAAAGKWDDLKVLQDELKGGRAK